MLTRLSRCAVLAVVGIAGCANPLNLGWFGNGGLPAQSEPEIVSEDVSDEYDDESADD